MLSAPKKVLVTGEAGFLGSHICKKLIEQNTFVIALDNFNTGFEENIQDLIKNQNFKLIHHDVCDPIDLNVNEVYHLACPASPPHYQKDPVYTLKTNFYGSQNMINLAIKNNAKILFTSTSEVYGDPKEHPQLSLSINSLKEDQVSQYMIKDLAKMRRRYLKIEYSEDKYAALDNKDALIKNK